jgi:serine/threonine protein kinase
MTAPERWARVQALCEELESQPDTTQEAFLERAESNPEIRDEVRQMLAALRDEAQAQAAPPPPPAEPAKTIGTYTITALLGQGGTGTVYAAAIDRAGVPQPVAVKLLHAHATSPEARERFRREQQMLAQLDHPGIIRVIDAGVTSDQQPYLVMDRVDGEPIDQYCDRHYLPIDDRLRLMIEVCDAVQAAHRALIVHLDLKPSNLLVTHDGRAKLLDFGTAKLVRPGDLTSTRQMTPLYASPEQLRGENVTTACDVFSLGVILFELLTGGWPFGSRDSMLSVLERATGHTDSRKLTELLSPEAAARRGNQRHRSPQNPAGRPPGHPH